MKGNRWDDHYTRRARDEKWLARSVYKLQEIDRKFHVIHPGDNILDLGCYPGSWSQYGLQKVGPKGRVTGIDLLVPNRLSSPNFRFIQGDIFQIEPETFRLEMGPSDLVISDMAPKTTGNRISDVSRSMALARRACEFALILLKGRGNFVCKIFEGEDLKAFKSDISKYFKQVRVFRSQAIRKRSKETYLLGLDFLREP